MDKLPVKQCSKCGSFNRNKQGNCGDCAKAISVIYREKNKEKIKAYRVANSSKHSSSKSSKEWRARNPENAIEYRLKNKQKIAAINALWASKNIEKMRTYTQNRRAAKRENGGSISPDIAKKLLVLQRGRCACCGIPLGNSYHLDHKMPIALGGSNSDDNIQLLTPRCNMQKHNKHPVDFMQSRGFLL